MGSNPIRSGFERVGVSVRAQQWPELWLSHQLEFMGKINHRRGWVILAKMAKGVMYNNNT